MDNYETVEKIIADKYNCETTTRGAIGDFMIDEDFAVDVKSNNLDKNNFAPNLVSANKVFDWLEGGNELAYIFVDYRVVNGKVQIEKETDLVYIQHIKWDCLKINCQGLGVIQRAKPLDVDENQTLEDWFDGLSKEYRTYINKERIKLTKLEDKFCSVDEGWRKGTVWGIS